MRLLHNVLHIFIFLTVMHKYRPVMALTQAMAAKQAGQSSADVAASPDRFRDGTGTPHLHPAHRLLPHLTFHHLELRRILFLKTLHLVLLVFLYPLTFKD